ncbi:hypothetical protein E5288_WYG006858 [Bos mutus]|uniref:Uncharacterized protein n=1 Tax=Bos mutus TaxID=72004 RepID=A0A6B0SHH7_9CETA|nr:hypothetical protein [Bos mutus]
MGFGQSHSSVADGSKESAKLPSALDTQNSFGHSLEKVSLQPALDACKVKWPPSDVCPEHLATPNGKTEKLVVGKGLPRSANVGFFLCSSKQSASAMGNKTSSFRGARGETKDFLYRFEKCSESWISIISTDASEFSPAPSTAFM